MGNDFVLELTSGAIRTGMVLAAPMMFSALIVGIIVAIFQAVTQINEQTLTFIPKILVILGVLALSSPWMMETMSDYTRDLYTNIPQWVVQR